MSFETITTASVQWLWEQYGKDLTSKTLGRISKQWAKFRWHDAEIKYRNSVYEQHSITRLLGNPKPINIIDIYTDVYVLDKPSAFRLFSLEELQARQERNEMFELDNKRKPALRLVTSEKRLFILGKPGSGKSTLLKFLALKSCDGTIPMTPIFLSLREWADSKLELIPFLVQQFDICAFPNAQDFIENLLAKGNALVLFDGLDEVNQEGDERAKMIRTLSNFSKKYTNNHISITCRIAATDYSFDQFTYLQIADFDKKQMRLFANKWYKVNDAKLNGFLTELEKPENQGILELTRTPLLLALLCLYFEETLRFPTRPAELYKDALDTLIKKWDASRGIQRDEIYRDFPSIRKFQLLTYLAAENFETAAYFVRQETVAMQIVQYLKQINKYPKDDTIDGEAILKAIEMQHGLLVERAHGIYSFSHLSIQEYLTARYILENSSTGALNRLIQNHLTDNRWYEVFLLTASLLEKADVMFDIFVKAIEEIIRNDEQLCMLINWINNMAAKKMISRSGGRATFTIIALASVIYKDKTDDHDQAFSLMKSILQALAPAFEIVSALDPNYLTAITRAKETASDIQSAIDYDSALNRSRSLSLKLVTEFTSDIGIELQVMDLNYSWHLIPARADLFCQYLEANRLLLQCLPEANVSKRESIETKLFILSPT